MNKQLKVLYDNECQRLKKSNIKTHEFDGPLLMYCWEQEYLNSEYKMLFIGRESNGWLGDLHTESEGSIKRYKEFELCENGAYTTFWQYIYDTKNILMPKSIGQKNFLWSNLSKFSKLDGKAISIEDFKFFCDNFRVLESELSILKPDAVIFFTGQSWDEKIQYQISDKIEYHQVSIEIPKNELARLSSIHLPKHTYRVDHPITLQLNKKWSLMELIIDNIRISK